MASDGSRLIDLIVDMVDDEEVIETVIEHFAGSLVSVPYTPTAANWLVGIVGAETALAIFRAFHGPTIFRHSTGYMVLLPSAERSPMEKARREVGRRLKLGQSVDRIAREVGVHRRTVYRHRAALKRLTRQNAASRTEGPTKC